MEEILLPDGQIFWEPHFYSSAESEKLFQSLMEEIAWEQRHIQLFGKTFPQPRLTAWYGDPGKSYQYSGLNWEPLPWSALLLEIKGRIEHSCPHPFNSVLLNLYRDGQDSMGWHSDDEPELGQNPVIASLSFGAARRFHLRHKHRKDIPTQKMALNTGSLLIMAGNTQHFWQHQISKTKKMVGPRINLTFRNIL